MNDRHGSKGVRRPQNPQKGGVNRHLTHLHGYTSTTYIGYNLRKCCLLVRLRQKFLSFDENCTKNVTMMITRFLVSICIIVQTQCTSVKLAPTVCGFCRLSVWRSKAFGDFHFRYTGLHYTLACDHTAINHNDDPHHHATRRVQVKSRVTLTDSKCGLPV